MDAAEPKGAVSAAGNQCQRDCCSEVHRPDQARAEGTLPLHVLQPCMLAANHRHLQNPCLHKAYDTQGLAFL